MRHVIGITHKTSQPDEIDIKILELSLANPHTTDEEIGKVVGLTRESVLRRKQRAGYQSLLTPTLNITQSCLERIFKKAINELETLLDDPDSRIRLTAISLALKFMPEQAKFVVSQESLEVLTKQSDFYDELLKIPGVGNAIMVRIIEQTNSTD
jgi:hypothetical protein